MRCATRKSDLAETRSMSIHRRSGGGGHTFTGTSTRRHSSATTRASSATRGAARGRSSSGTCGRTLDKPTATTTTTAVRDRVEPRYWRAAVFVSAHPQDPAVEPLGGEARVPLHRVLDRLGLLDAVRLPRIDDHLHRHALSLQRVVELVTLRHRHAAVVLTVLDGVGVVTPLTLNMAERARHLSKTSPVSPAEVVGDESGNVGGAGEAHEVGDAAPTDAALKRLVCVITHEVMSPP